MSSLKHFIRFALRKAGYELVPYPPVDWARSRQVLPAILSKKHINCVLDVGANQGQFGSVLREVGYTGRIVSFEPVRQTFEALARTAQKYPGDWRVRNQALGAEAGVAEINVCEGSVFSSFLTPKEDSLTRFPTNRTERVEVVQVGKLDDVLPECIEGLDDPQIYLKMDTQGFDLEVIKGAVQSMPRIVALQTEISIEHVYENMRSFSDSLSTMMSLGFEIFDFMPVSRDSDGLGVIEMDCVMTRSNRDASGGSHST
jgi:FkbM family methyltransferase